MAICLFFHLYVVGNHSCDSFVWRIYSEGVSPVCSLNALKNDILDQLRWNGCMSTGELAKALNYSKITVAMRRAISELMASGEIEFKYPDNPRHPQQKLCITRRLIS